MTTTNTPTPPANAPEEDGLFSGLFTALVMQHTNLALTFLGRAPNPETGETTLDLESARLLIDTLEMLSAKTKGNLTKQESDLLNRNLTYLRLTFVEAVRTEPKAPQHPTPPSEAVPPVDGAPPSASTPGETAPPATPSTPEAPADESRKKFVKKY